MVARLTPDQKVACSIHVGFNPRYGLSLLFLAFCKISHALLGLPALKAHDNRYTLTLSFGPTIYAQKSLRYQIKLVFTV